jgi:hypothetical protein
VSVHGTYSALEPSLDGEEPTAFKAVVLSYRMAVAVGVERSVGSREKVLRPPQ